MGVGDDEWEWGDDEWEWGDDEWEWGDDEWECGDDEAWEESEEVGGQYCLSLAVIGLTHWDQSHCYAF